jgi:hypothetical protein
MYTSYINNVMDTQDAVAARTSIVVMRVHSGIGNQLFQWAYGHVLSKKSEVHYDISSYRSQASNPSFSPRKFSIPLLLGKQINLLDGYTYNKLSTSKLVRVNDKSGFRVLDVNNEYDYILNGYWQNYRYFWNHRKEIKSIINLQKINEYDFTDSCSLHIRRGDYLQNQDTHPVLDISYYKKALEIINPSGKIYVLSDDLKWCRENIGIPNAVFVDNDCPIHNLSVMSQCSNNIIANSTFSWWGAFLNKNEDKEVVYPNNWLDPYGSNRENFCPTSWTSA